LSNEQRSAFRGHVWGHDFTVARTRDGRPLRLLTIIREYTWECAPIDVARRMTNDEVMGCREWCLMLPAFAQRAGVRGEGGREVAEQGRSEDLVYRAWGNVYVESFNGSASAVFANQVVSKTLANAEKVNIGNGDRDSLETVAHTVEIGVTTDGVESDGSANKAKAF
jgi:hypothetical protein